MLQEPWHGQCKCVLDSAVLPTHNESNSSRDAEEEGGGGGVKFGVPNMAQIRFSFSNVYFSPYEIWVQLPRVTFRLVVVSLWGPGQSPGLPFACCVGSLLSVGCCGRCSCWCRLRVGGAQWLGVGVVPAVHRGGAPPPPPPSSGCQPFSHPCPPPSCALLRACGTSGAPPPRGHGLWVSYGMMDRHVPIPKGKRGRAGQRTGSEIHELHDEPPPPPANACAPTDTVRAVTWRLRGGHGGGGGGGGASVEGGLSRVHGGGREYVWWGQHLALRWGKTESLLGQSRGQGGRGVGGGGVAGGIKAE